MNKLFIVSAIVLFASGASAQQAVAPPDAAFMQRAITSLQTQRNTALDNQAVAEAKATGLTEDLAKANAKIKELEDKINPPKKEQDKK
jgi:hypothetical protein